MISATQRFPKWMREEYFTIEHRMECPAAIRFKVELGGKTMFYIGYGPSICTAAKEARKAREQNK